VRIERLILSNYRQFRELDIHFATKQDHDLHLFVAPTGTAKTNLVNAINWCLYYQEPHLTADSQLLPIINLKAIEEACDDADQEVKVEIWAKAKKDETIAFVRKGIYRVRSKQPVHQKTEFEVRVTDPKGNTKLLIDEDAHSYVERFVPQRIREFFFFDGERLDSYFREATGDKVRSAIFQISQIDLLDTVSEKLDLVLRELLKEAGKESPSIDATRANLEKAENSRKDCLQKIGECEKQIDMASARIKELRERLVGMPDAQTLEKERQDLGAERKRKEEVLKAKEAQKRDLLFEYATIIPLWLAIEKSTQVIAKKRAEGEIPPTVDKSLLEGILNEKVCKICGRSLDSLAVRHVRDVLEQVTLSSEVAQQLLRMEHPLGMFEDKVKDFEKNISRISKDIGDLKADMGRIEESIKKINTALSGHNTEQIREWNEALNQFEGLRADNQTRLGELKEAQRRVDTEIQRHKAELDREFKKVEKVKKLGKEKVFCAKALDIAQKTKEAILQEMKDKIEYETKRLFLELVWKKESFKDVRIDQKYQISLIHWMGWECLGTVSAGERELLALAFTLALHKVSGFDSPIVIDTPVARLAGESRENFGRVLCQVSKDKQCILLFHDDEYSSNIRKYMDSKAASRSLFRLSQDEKEVKMEVLSNA